MNRESLLRLAACLPGRFSKSVRFLGVAAMVLLVLRWCVDAVLLANLCPSKQRLMSELSNETIAALDGFRTHSLRVSAVILGILLLTPAVALLFGKIKTAFLTLVFVLVCLFAEPRDRLPWEIVFPLEDQARTACANIVRQAELAKLGSEGRYSAPLHGFERRSWRFGGGRYEIWKSESGSCFLSDMRSRPNWYAEGEWYDRVLLEDVVRWNDCKDHLYVVTRDGRRYVLDYVTCELSPLGKEDAK